MTKLQVDHTGALLIPAKELMRLGLQPGDCVGIEANDTGVLLRKQVTAAPPANPVQQAIARKNLTTGIQFIKGVGPKLAELLAKRGIRSVEDALFCLPHRYEDRRQLIPIRQLKPGSNHVFQGTVISTESTETKRRPQGL
jgi:ATP-dependent DNA helicase RecG (EC 3.6.1.-)